MDKPNLRDYITGLLAVGGVALLCCEAPTLARQALVAASGLALWGLAAVVWRFGDHLTRLMLQVAQTACAGLGLILVKAGLAIWDKSGTKVIWNLNCKEIIINYKSKAPCETSISQSARERT